MVNSMEKRLMLLPCRKFERPVLVSIPRDFGSEEAYRRVTGLIAEIEEEGAGNYTREDLLEGLEGYGFEVVEYELGPSLD